MLSLKPLNCYVCNIKKIYFAFALLNSFDFWLDQILAAIKWCLSSYVHRQRIQLNELMAWICCCFWALNPIPFFCYVYISVYLQHATMLDVWTKYDIWNDLVIVTFIFFSFRFRQKNGRNKNPFFVVVIVGFIFSDIYNKVQKL